MNWEKRERILEPYYRGPESGGIRYFVDVPYEVLLKLVVRGFAQVEERQNDAPSIGFVLDAFESYKDRVKFSGYAVSPRRPDARVSIDTIQFDDSGDCGAKFRDIIDTLAESADEVTKNSLWWD